MSLFKTLVAAGAKAYEGGSPLWVRNGAVAAKLSLGTKDGVSVDLTQSEGDFAGWELVVKDETSGQRAFFPVVTTGDARPTATEYIIAPAKAVRDYDEGGIYEGDESKHKDGSPKLRAFPA